MLIAFLTLFLAAATFLVYEILLMKILSLVGWSHYAYMVVSLSMLGLGFSGVMLGLFHNFFLKYRNLFILAGGFAFSLLLPLTFYVNQRLPLNYLYLMWDWRQFIYIGLSYFLYGLPFFLISTILAIFFLKYPEKTNQVYAVNLLGSGFGIFCGIAIMYLAPAELYIFIGSFFSALMSLCWGLNYKGLKKKAAVAAAFAVIILINSLLIPSCLMPYISEYKGLPALLRLPGTEIVDRYYSPMGMLHVLEGDKIRIVSGLSITHRQMPPPQKALTFDGDAACAIIDPAHVTDDYFEDLIFSAAYKLRPEPEVLLVGAGGFASALLADFHKAKSITVLEINPQVASALKNNLSDSFHRLQAEANIEIKKTDARSYIEKTGRGFDIIQMDPAGTMGSSASGLYSQNEDYLNTVEAYKLFVSRLNPEGLFMISRWMSIPPKDGIKLFATGLRALEELGVESPENNLVLIRNWDVITLLIKRSPFSESERGRLREFCRQKHFDISYMPRMDISEANRFHVMPEPVYFEAAAKIINKIEREAFFAGYIFNVEPAFDNKPYFSHFFKWSALPHLIETLNREWIPFSEYGYLILLATFIQALIVGGLVIILPLGVMLIRRRKDKRVRFKFNTWLYFAFLGLAFMILEIGLIQKFILFLHNPIYSAAIVIGSFLTISGAGSLLSKRIFAKKNKNQLFPFLIIFILAVCYALFLDSIFFRLMGLNFYFKLFLSILIIAPLALMLGIPFPLGMQKISATGEVNTGAAWGCNGFFSVAGAILTPILAMLLGSQIVILIGAFCYLPAMLMWGLGFEPSGRQKL